MAAGNTDILLDAQNGLQTSATSTPPSPDATEGSDHKLSRKREREVSLEPSTPKPDIEDHATAPSKTSSGLRSPKKRNRIQLDPTEEEDVSSKSRSPSRSRSRSRSSPPHEVKVRQISQGVEDINWRQKEIAAAAAGDIDSNILPLDPTDESATPLVATSPTPSSPVTIDAAEVSPDCSMDKSQESMHTRRASGSDGEDRDKGLKRKLADRATSRGPENGDVPKTINDVETSKRSRDEDDNPRAKKRPTPPRTPEAVGEKPTPPTTPPSDSGELPKPCEALKRPRDEDDDDNPRQAKKPSPPPEKTLDKKAPSTTPKLGGFMAYASTSSPFASVKGQNLFGGSSKLAPLSKEPSSTSPSSANFPLTSPFAAPSFTLGDTSASVPTATKRTGFEAFSGSTSPFASVTRTKSPAALGSTAFRSKSPNRRVPATAIKASAFSSYASGGAQAFAVPMPKRAQAGSPDGSSSRSSLERNPTLSAFGTQQDEDDSRRDDGQLSFGEKLRAGKDAEEEASDEDDKPELTAQAVQTGEEEEKSMHMVRAKLFRLSDQNQWKERGTGTLKLNVRKFDGEGARLVMRKEAVFTVLLNVTLFYGMSVFVAQDPRYIRLSVIEDGMTAHYNLRVASAKIGEELLDAIKAYIPPAPI